MYPRRAREEGESEGGKPLPRDPGAVDAGWAHALSSRASCQLGRCAYVDPARRNSDFAGTGCDGYHASRHEEPDGRVTIRWGLCPRHREWWRLERIRRSAERSARAERGKS